MYLQRPELKTWILSILECITWCLPVHHQNFYTFRIQIPNLVPESWILQHLFLLAFSPPSMFTKTVITAITKFKSSVWGHCLNHFVDFSYSVCFCLCNRANKCIYASYNFKSLFLFWYLCCKCSSNKIIGHWPSYVCACTKHMNSSKHTVVCLDYKSEDYFSGL